MVERTPTLTAAVDAALVQVQKLQDTEFAAGANRLWLADLLQEVKKAAFECLTGGLCTLGDVLR